MTTYTFNTRTLEGSKDFLEGVKETADDAVRNLATMVSILSKAEQLAIDESYFTELMSMLQTISRMSASQGAKIRAELDIRRAVEEGTARAARLSAMYPEALAL